MKMIRVAMAGALALTGAALVVPSAAADESYVADPALNACINTAVTQAGGLAAVKTIDCENAGVKSLAGIDRLAGQVTLFNLGGNEINDLTPLDAFQTSGVETYVWMYNQAVTLPQAFVGVSQTVFASDLTNLPSASASVNDASLVTPDASYKSWTFKKPGTGVLTVTNNGVAADDLHVNYSGTITQTAVYAPPAITDQPANQAVALGEAATFEVKATTNNPVYTATWQYYDTETSTWVALPDDPARYASAERSGTFTENVTPDRWSMDGLQVRLLVKTAEGTATSDAATLTIADAPQLVTGVVDVTAKAGGDFTLEAFFNSVAGTVPTTQWEVSNDGVRWEAIDGATPVAVVDASGVAMYQAFLTVSNAAVSMDGLQFRVTATNAYGSTVSNAGTLIVTAADPSTSDPDESTATVANPTAGTTVAASVVSKTLARTGSGNTLPLLGIGGALVLAGAALVTIVSLRRRRSA